MNDVNTLIIFYCIVEGKYKNTKKNIQVSVVVLFLIDSIQMLVVLWQVLFDCKMYICFMCLLIYLLLISEYSNRYNIYIVKY